MTTASQRSGSASAAAVHRPAPRSLLIDVVRGIAITLVVVGHTDQGILHRGWWHGSPFGLRLDQAIYSFHMPAFFFVSGVFLRPGVDKRGQGRYAEGKLRSMIYPYLLWSTLTYLAERFLLHAYVVTVPRTTGEFLVALLTADISWFLPTIFLALMVGMLVRKLPAVPVFAFAVAAQLLMPWLHAPDLDDLFKFLPFLLLGLWTGRGFERFEKIPAGLAAAAGLALAGAITVCTALPYGDHRWTLVPLGVVGTVMLMLVARALGRSPVARVLAWAGEGSFGIFLMSSYFQGGGRVLVQKVLHSEDPWLQLIIPSLLATLLPGWIYQYRDRLRMGWMFVWPTRQGGGGHALTPPAPLPPEPSPS